jgi:hypothetical protein
VDPVPVFSKRLDPVYSILQKCLKHLDTNIIFDALTCESLVFFFHEEKYQKRYKKNNIFDFIDIFQNYCVISTLGSRSGN